MQEVFELFKDLAMLVDQQQESLEVIENRIIRAKGYTEKAEVRSMTNVGVQDFFVFCLPTNVRVIFTARVAKCRELPKKKSKDAMLHTDRCSFDTGSCGGCSGGIPK